MSIDLDSMKNSQYFQTLSCLLPALPKSMYDHTVSFILMLYFCLFCSFKISVTAVLGQPCRWTYSFLLWRLLLPTDRKWVSIVVNKSESEKSMLMVKVNVKCVANIVFRPWVTELPIFSNFIFRRLGEGYSNSTFSSLPHCSCNTKRTSSCWGLQGGIEA